MACVTYIIPAPPLTKSVHVTAETLGKRARTVIQCSPRLAAGTRVVRGPHWRDGNNDGGPGSVGIVQRNRLWGIVAVVEWSKNSRQKSYDFGPSVCQIKTEV